MSYIYRCLSVRLCYCNIKNVVIVLWNSPSIVYTIALHQALLITPQAAVQSIVMSNSHLLSTHVTWKPYSRTSSKFVRACCLWASIGPALKALWYAMYFRFSGCDIYHTVRPMPESSSTLCLEVCQVDVRLVFDRVHQNVSLGEGRGQNLLSCF